MSTKIDGKQITTEIKTNLAERMSKPKAQGIQLGPSTLLVGEDPGPMRYVADKHADCQEVGIISARKELPAGASFGDIAVTVRELNEDPACTGFIVRLSSPKGINENAIIDMTDPAKDTDGMHPYSLDELALHVRGDVSTPLPCTPHGMLELLGAYDIDLNGKEVCVLGRGITIGRTIGLMLTCNTVNATVTLCHTGTWGVADHTHRADVIVTAMDSTGFVTPDKIKDGAVLVDVGVSRVYDEKVGRYRIKGDVNKACYDKASAYIPNPEGVGPTTRAMLLANVVEMAGRRA